MKVFVAYMKRLDKLWKHMKALSDIGRKLKLCERLKAHYSFSREEIKRLIGILGN